jgi:hypothetical protein
MPHQAWQLLGSRNVAEYKTIRVREDRYHFAPNAVEADFVVCESPDWVLILPVTVDRQVC